MHTTQRLLKNCLLATLISLLGLTSIGNVAQSQTIRNKLSAAVDGPLDSRVKVFAYNPDIVFTLYVGEGMHTHIALADDEELTEKPRLGETLQWRVAGNIHNIYVKALKLGISTSMTLVTTKRSYQFELIATDKPKDRTQKAYFSYPEDEEKLELVARAAEQQAKVAATQARAEQIRKSAEVLGPASDPSQLNFNYLPPTGDPELIPRAVFDDGVFTYIRLAKSQDLPVVFEVNAENKLTPINYEVRRDELKLERIANKWVLRIGKREVQIQKSGK